VTLENKTGTDIENARLLITRVTEELRHESSRPADTGNKRYLRVDMSTPIVFGDIANGTTSDEGSLTITGFHDASDTTRTVVEGVILNGRS